MWRVLGLSLAARGRTSGEVVAIEVPCLRGLVDGRQSCVAWLRRPYASIYTVWLLDGVQESRLCEEAGFLKVLVDLGVDINKRLLRRLEPVRDLIAESLDLKIPQL